MGNTINSRYLGISMSFAVVHRLRSCANVSDCLGKLIMHEESLDKTFTIKANAWFFCVVAHIYKVVHWISTGFPTLLAPSLPPFRSLELSFNRLLDDIFTSLRPYWLCGLGFRHKTTDGQKSRSR